MIHYKKEMLWHYKPILVRTLALCSHEVNMTKYFFAILKEPVFVQTGPEKSTVGLSGSTWMCDQLIDWCTFFTCASVAAGGRKEIWGSLWVQRSLDILARGCCEIEPGEALWKLKLAPPDEEEAEWEELLPLLQMKAEAWRCFWTLEPLCLFLSLDLFSCVLLADKCLR